MFYCFNVSVQHFALSIKLDWIGYSARAGSVKLQAEALLVMRGVAFRRPAGLLAKSKVHSAAFGLSRCTECRQVSQTCFFSFLISQQGLVAYLFEIIPFFYIRTTFNNL